MLTAAAPFSELNLQEVSSVLFYIASKEIIPKIPDFVSIEGRRFLLHCFRR